MIFTRPTFFYLIASSIALCCVAPHLQADTNPVSLSGVLQLKKTGKENWLCLNLPSPKTFSLNSQEIESKQLQVAGLSTQNWQAALLLLDKKVTATGTPMSQHSPHHHTPLLWITSSLSATPSAPLPSSNPAPKKSYSREW